jgi:hypothetical protein
MKAGGTKGPSIFETTYSFIMNLYSSWTNGLIFTFIVIAFFVFIYLGGFLIMKGNDYNNQNS